jgi:hypothetical protein
MKAEILAEFIKKRRKLIVMVPGSKNVKLGSVISPKCSHLSGVWARVLYYDFLKKILCYLLSWIRTVTNSFVLT